MYKDEEYWARVQAEEAAEEEARWAYKCAWEDRMNAKPAKRIWTEEEIRNMIQNDDRVLYGALKKLYAEQTSDERNEGQTKHYNGVGFNGADSRFLSSVAEFLLKTGFLTGKQKAVTRKKLIKYNKQLTRLANA